MLTIWHASTSFIYACARIQHRSFFFSVPLETLKKIELILTISWKTGKMFGDIKSEYRSLVSRKRTRGKKKERAFVFVQSSDAFSTFSGCLTTKQKNNQTVRHSWCSVKTVGHCPELNKTLWAVNRGPFMQNGPSKNSGKMLGYPSIGTLCTRRYGGTLAEKQDSAWHSAPLLWVTQATALFLCVSKRGKYL
jgi:hypothetical protein